MLIQPHFSFEDFVAKDSTALTAAEDIDQGVGGVAPLYIRVPLLENDPNVGDQGFRDDPDGPSKFSRSELGENKVISAASMSNYTETGFTREEVFDAVGPFMRKRFVTDDGSQALVTGFMPTIIDSDTLKQSGRHGRARRSTTAGIEGRRNRRLPRADHLCHRPDRARAAARPDRVSVLVNLALIGFAFQSFRVALASAIPNLFPVLGTEAWLYFTGQGLQLTTVIALTIAFGIAVDDTVHFLSHYLHSRREERRPHMERSSTRWSGSAGRSSPPPSSCAPARRS